MSEVNYPRGIRSCNRWFYVLRVGISRVDLQRMSKKMLQSRWYLFPGESLQSRDNLRNVHLTDEVGQRNIKS